MRRRTARRCGQAGTSATVAINDLVQELRAAGEPVLDVGGGNPCFDAAEHVTAETVAALRNGFTRYTASRGLPELLAAVAEKLRAENGITVDPATQVIVTPSSKYALFLAFMTLLDPGDEILVPTPSWVSYRAMARLAGARPVAVPLRAEEDFALTGRRLREHLSDRTRAIVVNTPNNPTGRMLSEAEAAEVAAFAREHDLIIVTDEIYEKIVFGDDVHLSMAAMPGCADRTVTVNGFSKAYAMPGWRLGYAAGPVDIMTAMLAVHQHTVACAGSFAQRGGVAALTGPQESVAEMTAGYARNARLVVEGLNALPGVTCRMPQGAFYAFPDVTGTGLDSADVFAERLLKEARVAVAPGSAFGPGGEGHIRLSLAAEPGVLKEVLSRMATFVNPPSFVYKPNQSE